MSTITKKELIDRIAEKTQAKRVLVKKIVQEFLDEISKKSFGKENSPRISR
jgi:nucleoid DNA-binding protein